MASLSEELEQKNQQQMLLERQLATVRLPPPITLPSCAHLLHAQTPLTVPNFPKPLTKSLVLREGRFISSHLLRAMAY